MDASDIVTVDVHDAVGFGHRYRVVEALDEPQGVSLGDGAGFEHAKVKAGAVGCLHEPRQFFHAPARGYGGAGTAWLRDLYAQIVELVDVAEVYVPVGEPFEGEVFEEGAFG